ncbi:MAG TPA: hypothetical protein VFY29_02715 [Terriglobia bacterium]|nr:hypothetical protein [Terriglobia bacterium]
MAWVVYWPVLIALWSAFSLVRNRERSRYWRVGGLEAALLLGIIIGGGVLTAGGNLSARLGRVLGLDTTADVWSVMGDSYTFPETIDMEVAPESGEALIEVFNLYGDVEIRPQPGTNLSVTADRTIRASSRTEANRLAGEFTFHVTPRNGGILVQSSLDDGVRPAPREWFRSSLTLDVPANSRARVVNRWGNVIVHGSIPVETEVVHGHVQHVN